MPFVEVCIENDMASEAAKYIAKLPDARRRAEQYERIGDLQSAAEAAVQAKVKPVAQRAPDMSANHPHFVYAQDGELAERLRNAFDALGSNLVRCAEWWWSMQLCPCV